MNIEPDDARAAGAAVHLGVAVVHLRAGAREPAVHHVPARRHAGARAAAGRRSTSTATSTSRPRRSSARPPTTRKLPRRQPGRDAVVDRRARPTATRGCGASIALRNAHRRAAPASPTGRACCCRSCRIATPRSGTVYADVSDDRQRRASRPNSACSIDGAAGARRRCAPRSRASRCQTGSRAPTAWRSRWSTSSCAGSTIRCSRSTRAVVALDRLRPTAAGADVRRRDRRQRRDVPGGGAPTLTVIAQDRRHRMQEGTKVRWFAIPIPSVGNLPLPDIAIAAIVDAREPAACRSSIRSARRCRSCSAASTRSSRSPIPDAAQKVIRKQANESDSTSSTRIARGERLGHADRPRRAGSAGTCCASCRRSITSTPDVDAALRPVADRFHAADHRRSARSRRSAATSGCRRSRSSFTVTLGWDWDRMCADARDLPRLRADRHGAPCGLPDRGAADAAPSRRASSSPS